MRFFVPALVAISLMFAACATDNNAVEPEPMPISEAFAIAKTTNIAGGFVGAYIGMYASSNGQASNNIADFDWFEYTFTD